MVAFGKSIQPHGRYGRDFWPPMLEILAAYRELVSGGTDRTRADLVPGNCKSPSAGGRHIRVQHRAAGCPGSIEPSGRNPAGHGLSPLGLVRRRLFRGVVEMTRQRSVLLIVSLSVLGLAAAAVRVPALFIASDRCQACHNGLVTPRGEDISFGSSGGPR